MGAGIAFNHKPSLAPCAMIPELPVRTRWVVAQIDVSGETFKGVDRFWIRTLRC
jgi:hypothetical protein